MSEIGGKSGKLPPTEAAKRVRAARELAGFRDQAKFRRAIQAAKGFPPNRIKTIESESGAELQGHEIELLARFLSVPEAWFTEPLSELFTIRDPDQLGRIESALERIEERLVGDPTQELEDDGQGEEQGESGSE